MPTYDMKCSSCQQLSEVFCKIAERELQVCHCGSALQVQISMPNFVPFHGGWHHNIDIEPIYIKNKRQLQHECQRRGLTSMYVEGSTFSEI